MENIKSFGEWLGRVSTRTARAAANELTGELMGEFDDRDPAAVVVRPPRRSPLVLLL